MDFELYVKGGIAGGIVVILQVIKSLDKSKKLQKGFYILSALILGFLTGFITTSFYTPLIHWIQESIGAGIAMGGAASLLYQTGKLTIGGNSSETSQTFISKIVDNHVSGNKENKPDDSESVGK